MNTHTETENDYEEDLTCMEDFANTEPQSDFAIFFFTFWGTMVGIIFSTKIDGFLIGGYNIGGIIICVICGTIGCYLGILVKRIIDNYNTTTYVLQRSLKG